MPGTATIHTLESPSRPRWHVLWTRSNCEQLVADRLTAKGFDVFLPRMSAWSRRGGHQRLADEPMFRGYLFLHHLMDKTAYTEIRKSIGLVSILGERWDRLATVPESEIASIQQVAQAGLPVLPYPYLREGERIRIARGPLADVEGIFIRANLTKGLLVVSINMLQRSIAVEVDCTLVSAA